MMLQEIGPTCKIKCGTVPGAKAYPNQNAVHHRHIAGMATRSDLYYYPAVSCFSCTLFMQPFS
uniref:Uncharacterized protein n=1 Tax=Candidatus Kentrum sp. FM TaxID=2126340 RepID=A0A450TYF7_9GAMM|nr:MAG: hypothetical protein BECKFM1743A_GA0114220_102881 [Candidatus Kentron sp. FM]VFJ74543.1 MAG: hypothetical protein BECKFM1743C_GA0114222_107972 [Candidatus Kentron sp. FM]VFK14468.1 MAG: hypothetical protein BECKFM1743B_GA0114221_103231 [Candidatus Kentron sp. FM]